MERNKFDVVCEPCNYTAGTVQEVEARPGFFINQSEPAFLPTRCPQCERVFTRREVCQ